MLFVDADTVSIIIRYCDFMLCLTFYYCIHHCAINTNFSQKVKQGVLLVFCFRSCPVGFWAVWSLVFWSCRNIWTLTTAEKMQPSQYVKATHIRSHHTFIKRTTTWPTVKMFASGPLWPAYCLSFSVVSKLQVNISQVSWWWGDHLSTWRHRRKGLKNKPQYTANLCKSL